MEVIRSAQVRRLRTSRHPSATLLDGAPSFDHLYESAETLDEVYAGIVEELVRLALSLPPEGAGVVYAVPGSPLVGERSVELLRAENRVRTEILPGLSFADLAFECLGVDPLTVGARFVDGHRFSEEAAGSSGQLLVGQCDSAVVLSEVKLAIGSALEGLGAPGTSTSGDRLEAPVGPEAGVGREVTVGREAALGPAVTVGREATLGPEVTVGREAALGPAVTVLQRLGLPDEAVFSVRWDELDRSFEPDHLTSLWVPELGAPFAGEMVRLEEIGRTLRQRCPWDRQQTHESLTRYLLEEAYETLEAIEELGPGGEGYEHLEEELGDVLFQVVFHSVLAAEEGQFALGDVARHVHEKLVRRHPHVFGSVDATTPEQVSRNWEEIKRRERAERGEERRGLMDGIARNLPALLYAYKIQGRAASVGFDWEEPEGALAKVGEEMAELEEALAGAAAGADRTADSAAAASAAGTGDSAAAGAAGAAVRDEVGDLLFSVVNVARKLKVDPEAALREAAAKFRRRFDAIDKLAQERGQELPDLTLEHLDKLWEEVKASESR